MILWWITENRKLFTVIYAFLSVFNHNKDSYRSTLFVSNWYEDVHAVALTSLFEQASSVARENPYATGLFHMMLCSAVKHFY